MKILFLCKASSQIGLGHLMRTRTLAEYASRLNDVEMVIIGFNSANRLTTGLPFRVNFASDDGEVTRYIFSEFDVVFFDMLSLQETTLQFIKSHAKMTVSICPIFDQMEHMDIMFNRTRYNHERNKELPCKKYLGIEYTIIQSSCRRIDTKVYRENLQRSVPAIAISMGGGDAANKTLKFLSVLRNCRINATLWVLLGEGYNHSYDSLMQALENDHKHEIILAKTNRSMWQILSRCLLAILPGGITTYEAAFAGLPTVNLFDQEDQFFLVRELVEAGFCVNAGLMNEGNLQLLNSTIEHLIQHRELLFAMHETSKGFIDGKGCARIIDRVEANLKNREAQTWQERELA